MTKILFTLFSFLLNCSSILANTQESLLNEQSVFVLERDNLLHRAKLIALTMSQEQYERETSTIRSELNIQQESLTHTNKKENFLSREIDDNKKICIHKYLTMCRTNPQPPGFGDFLRGTIALFELSRIYDYQLFIDSNIHPLFGFLEDNKNFIKEDYNFEVHELIPNSQYTSYNDIYNALKSLFEKKESFSLITNSFYTITNKSLKNFGPLTPECQLFLKEILTPNEELKNDIEDICDKINLDLKKGFTAIHLRFGDKSLNSDHYNEKTISSVNYKIKKLIQQNKNSQYILFSDSSSMAKKIKEDNPSLIYWDNKKIHLGDLKNNPEGIKDTLIDFFIMSKCDVIYSLNQSGFSLIVSLIYDKKYHILDYPKNNKWRS